MIQAERTSLIPILAVALAVVVALVFSIVRLDREAVSQSLRLAEQDRLLYLARVASDVEKSIAITRSLQLAIEPLIPLALGRSDQMVAESDLQDIANTLAQQLEDFASVDQVRILSITGQEILRVNLDIATGERVVAWPTESRFLQDKSGEFYFRGLEATTPGTIYLSRITLNREQGRLDPRLLPTMRLGTVMLDEDGERAAYLLVNARAWVADARRIKRGVVAPELFALDSDGNFVFGNRRFAGREFAWQTGSDVKNFAQEFPDIWQRILRESTGQAEIGDGLLSWQTSETESGAAFRELHRMGESELSVYVQFLPYEFLYVGTLRGSPWGWLVMSILACLFLISLVSVTRAITASKLASDAMGREGLANDTIEREADRRTRLLSTVAYDLRTPLASAAMLLTGRDTLPEVEVVELRDMISHALSLTDQVHSAGRAAPGSDQRPSAPLRISTLVADVVAQNRSLLDGAGFEVDVDIPKYFDRYFSLDRYRLTAAVTTLVRNAFMHSGGAQIWLSSSLTAIDELACSAELTLRVEDDGRGIAEDQQLPLYQATRNTYEEGGGTGAPLPLIGDWIKGMGGSLIYFDSPKGGAGFEIRLPVTLVDDTEVVWHSTLQKDGERLLSERDVLYVDDDAVMRRVTSRIIEGLGARVTVAKSGVEALECMAGQPFALLITDYFMPDMNGLELIEILRARGDDIPIMAVTAATLDTEVEALRKAGADMVVTKPLKEEEVLRFAGRFLKPGSVL